MSFGPDEADLGRFEVALKSSLAADDPMAAQPMADLVDAGGKRLRPAMLLLAGSLGDYHFDRLLPAAIAVELMHAATLVHDDVIDRSATRRGKPSVLAQVGAEAAIVIGDHYFAKAYRCAAQTGDSAVVEMLAQTVMEICIGEVAQQNARFRYRIGVDEYMERIRRKTAVLMSVSSRIGAHLSGFGEAEVEALSAWGRDLGIAFQIADDVLDYTASEEELGKPVAHDLAEGLATLPLILAMTESPEVGSLLNEGEALTPDAQAQVVSTVRTRGANSALEVARDWSVKAESHLGGFDGPAVEPMKALTHYVVNRNV